MSILETANVFVTGGAGTLGHAIAKRRKKEGWSGRMTVYSTSNHNHARMRMLYPDIQYVQGDIRNPTTLYNAMVGHDIVIHAAAVKVIPDSELYSIDTFDVNVNGSLVVYDCAARANIAHVLSISTDKACHAANAYGASKMMMEKASQEYSRIDGIKTSFHLVRYGNVLESSGSVIEAWKKAQMRGDKLKITDPEMTRFWLSPSRAVDYVKQALTYRSGVILVPEMPSLKIGKLLEYVTDGDYETERIPLRPGEKMHETLVTVEECDYANYSKGKFYLISPTYAGRNLMLEIGFSAPPVLSSDIAKELSKSDLLRLLDE